MNTMTNQLVKMATVGLTGRREYDITYLKEQISMFSDNESVVSILKNVLSCLAGAE